MPEAVSFSRLQKVFADHGFYCRKRWGQNFLVDDNIVRKIIAAAGLSSTDVVVEIGTGAGTLTRALAQEARLVITVEIDKRLIPVLNETLSSFSNVEVVFKDALRLDFDELVVEKVTARFGSKEIVPYLVIGNIPYSVTTPLLLHLLQGRFNWSFLFIMIQQEVARRLVAGPGSKDYGALSIAVQYYTTPKILFRVPATVFYPRPEVDSAVVCLQRLREPAVKVPDEGVFFNLVRGAFGQRRKTILNALAGSRVAPELTRAAWMKILLAARIDPERRGESLTIEEFAVLARQFGKK
jgi:16S rRNA (adenine1518-N6/adenine1519-N6)-dimethyltransferase